MYNRLSVLVCFFLGGVWKVNCCPLWNVVDMTCEHAAVFNSSRPVVFLSPSCLAFLVIFFVDALMKVWDMFSRFSSNQFVKDSLDLPQTW